MDGRQMDGHGHIYIPKPLAGDKNLDPSYKMDLELWDCLGRMKLVL